MNRYFQILINIPLFWGKICCFSVTLRYTSRTLKGSTLDDIHDAVPEVLEVLLVCHVSGAVLQVSQVSLSQLRHQLLVPDQETSRILFVLWTESDHLDLCVHLRVELAVTLTLVPVFSVQHLAIGQSEVSYCHLLTNKRVAKRIDCALID